MDIQRELKNDLTSITGVVELQDGIYLPLEQVEKILVKRLEQVKKLTITDVSQQRELLSVFDKWLYKNSNSEDKDRESIIDRYLKK